MNKLYRKIRRMLSGGIIGEIRTFEICAGNCEIREMICLLQYLLQQRVISVACRMSEPDDGGMADTVVCIFETDGSASGILNISRAALGVPYKDIVLNGSRGILRISELPQFKMTLTDEDGDEAVFDLSGTLSDKSPEKPAEEILPDAINAADACSRSLKEGRTIVIES